MTHSTEKDAPRWKEHRRKMAAGYFDRRDDDTAEKDAQRDLEDWLTDNRWPDAYDLSHALAGAGFARVFPPALPLHRTEAGYPNCSTCDGGGCLDCTDPA